MADGIIQQIRTKSGKVYDIQDKRFDDVTNIEIIPTQDKTDYEDIF